MILSIPSLLINGLNQDPSEICDISLCKEFFLAGGEGGGGVTKNTDTKHESVYIADVIKS